MIVVIVVSRRLGQVTLEVSERTSCRNLNGLKAILGGPRPCERIVSFSGNPNSPPAPSPLLKDEPASGLDFSGNSKPRRISVKRAGCRWRLCTAGGVKGQDNRNGRGKRPRREAPRPLVRLVATVASATTVASAAAVASAAGTTTAGPAATRGPTRAGPPDRAADHRTSGVADSNVAVSAVSAVPAVPSIPAAPAEATAPGVTAPIEARTAPAIVVPAVISSAEEELSLFDLIGNCRRCEAVDRQGAGLASHAHQGKGNRSCGRVDPMSHEGVSVLFWESRAAPRWRADRG